MYTIYISAMASPFDHLPESIRIQAEAHAFRSLVAHFQERPYVQNMETMTASGFCRNCLSKWLMSGYRSLAPLPLDQPLTYDDVSKHVYGMSPKDWKKEYQLPASEEQLRRYEESKKYHATHEKNVLEDVLVQSKHDTEVPTVLDPCCPDSTEAIPVDSNLNNTSLLSCSSNQTLLSFSEPPPMEVQLAVLTVSDRAYSQVYEDKSGPMVKKSFMDYSLKHTQVKVNVVSEHVVPDEFDQISSTLNEWAASSKCNLIITTGGTGLSARDVTPEATNSIISKLIPSIPLTICSETTYKYEPLSCLSRGVAGVVKGGALILNLPGSPRAVQQHLEVAIPLLLHALYTLRE